MRTVDWWSRTAVDWPLGSPVGRPQVEESRDDSFCVFWSQCYHMWRSERTCTHNGKLQLLFSGTIWFRIFGGFLHVLTTQIYHLTGAIISETHKIIIPIHNTKCDPPQYYSCWGCKGTVSHANDKAPIQHLPPDVMQGEGTLPLSLSQEV